MAFGFELPWDKQCIAVKQQDVPTGEQTTSAVVKVVDVRPTDKDETLHAETLRAGYLKLNAQKVSGDICKVTLPGDLPPVGTRVLVQFPDGNLVQFLTTENMLAASVVSLKTPPDTVGPKIQQSINNQRGTWDPKQQLSDSDLSQLSSTVTKTIRGFMRDEGRTSLDEDDLDWFVIAEIGKVFRSTVRRCLPKKKLRFEKGDRVMCNVGGERSWVAGSVMIVNEDPDEDDGEPVDFTLLNESDGSESSDEAEAAMLPGWVRRTRIPYVVKVDPPFPTATVDVPKDWNEIVRAEVCFGRRDDGLSFTRWCLPKAARKGAQRVRRFRKGDRVACAVEAPGDVETNWSKGTVMALEYPVAAEGGVEGGYVPYQVKLDDGSTVLVHEDEHRLVRDLALQPAGPRSAEDGTRPQRISKRKVEEGWLLVDHMTRKSRKLKAAELQEV